MNNPSPAPILAGMVGDAIYLASSGWDADSGKRLSAYSFESAVKMDSKNPRQFDITAYDACYAALSQQLSLPLITADATLINKLSTSPITIHAL